MTEMRYLEVNGDRIAYRDEGQGETLLLVHGMAGSSATWRELIPRLARNYRVVAPDLLGHGASDKPRGDYSLGAFAVWLRDFIDELGIARATVIGQSLGGGIAMQFAYQHRAALRTGGADRQRRPGTGPELDPAAAVGARAPSWCSRWWPRSRCSTSATRSGPWLASAGVQLARAAPNCGARIRRCPTVRPGGPSCAPCARWSTTAARPSAATEQAASGRTVAGAVDLGRTGPDHPGVARLRRARGTARQPAGRCSPDVGHFPHVEAPDRRRRPAGRTSSPTTERRVHADHPLLIARLGAVTSNDRHHRRQRRPRCGGRSADCTAAARTSSSSVAPRRRPPPWPRRWGPTTSSRISPTSPRCATWPHSCWSAIRASTCWPTTPAA